MVELFAKYESFAFFETLKTNVREEIKSLSDESILYTDNEELKNYYFENNKIQPISIFLDNKTKKLGKTKVGRYGCGYRTSGSSDEINYYDGFIVTFEIPFDGDNRLLYLHPSRYFMQRFNVNDIINANNDEYDKIIYLLDYTQYELKDKDSPDFFEKQFESNFKNYIQMFENIRLDVEQYNSSLPSLINNEIDNRKQKAKDFITLGEKFSIPLETDPNAPNIKPIVMKKITVKRPEMPKAKPKENDYAIKDSDFDNIKSIISMAGSSMERTAKTFKNIAEEGLRDYFLNVLNTHYKGNVTGETFSKAGKTDIHIPFGNKAAYIAECKIWHGEKQLQEALEQLFSYTTWRDVKTSVIIFNKANKDFNKVLEAITNFLNANELCKKSTNKNRNEWICEFLKSKDNTIYITVQIIVFDIFVEKV